MNFIIHWLYMFQACVQNTLINNFNFSFLLYLWTQKYVKCLVIENETKPSISILTTRRVQMKRRLFLVLKFRIVFKLRWTLIWSSCFVTAIYLLPAFSMENSKTLFVSLTNKPFLPWGPFNYTTENEQWLKCC